MAEEEINQVDINGAVYGLEDKTARLSNTWQEVTNDWGINYSSAGSPTIESAWIRQSTGEAVILVNYNGARVAAGESLSIVVHYNGQNETFKDVRGKYNRIAISAVSLTVDTSSGTYPSVLINTGVQVRNNETSLDFYVRMRNPTSSAGTAQKAQIHITL